jgi:hypothetical protein
MAVTMKNGVFWDVTPCNIPEDTILHVSNCSLWLSSLSDSFSVWTERLIGGDVWTARSANFFIRKHVWCRYGTKCFMPYITSDEAEVTNYGELCCI